MNFGSSTGFTFGSGGTNPPNTGATGAPQLSFTAPTPAATTSSLFSFGGAPPASTFSLGGMAPAATAPSTLSFGLSSGIGATVTSSAPSLTFGTVAPQPNLSFGAPPAATATPAITSAAVAPISFTSLAPGAGSGAVQPSFGLSTTTQPGATPGLSLGATTTTPAAPTGGFSFGAGGAALSAPIKPIATTTAAAPAPPISQDQPGVAPQLATATTTAQATQQPANMSQMNFRQLQEAINKWMIDLQEQEKIFLEQATKVNAWDRTLIDNGEKIGKLNESVTKVKADHARLEHAVEYLKNQQKEFDAFLEPLEAGLPVNVPVEPEREHLYGLTESVDTQLQQMAEDLKEVIRHINESNKTVDKSDPVSQILRILNEHTDALQWVEDNANAVRKSLDDVSKQHQVAKKEHERSLRTMFK
ncbi:unnamed protein product [Orchesella dallaii]|uniref:Nucleoporin NSP1-like C-terminal domain-containing protein n=1 Tax=Orchesella dallaii TaxID=48710 RepID=A0ABP1PWH7_9HEXA